MKAEDMIESIKKLNINNGDIVVVTAKLPQDRKTEIADYLAVQVTRVLPPEVEARIFICDSGVKIDVLEGNSAIATTTDEKS